MPFRIQLTAVALLPLLCGYAAQAAAPLSVIPVPAEMVRTEGSFHLSPATQLVCTQTNDAPCRFAAAYFAGLLQKTRGLALHQSDSAAGPAVVFRRTGEPSGESYALSVTPNGAEVVSGSDAGLLYGAITLFELASQESGYAATVDIPAVAVKDGPRFAWRGLMLDSARHFQSPDFVKSLLDAMALHKLNVLHWHLTDDQGWRIEIKKCPHLTKIGAWRSNARERHYGGFYTQDQIRGIVAYAKARNITIVPEIEMPGHALAAIVSYPRLGSVRHPPKRVSGDWGIFPYLYNADDETFTVLEDILTEVMALFPSPYIHVGGDEAPKDQWNASPAVQARLKALDIKDSDALQGYFTGRIGRFLETRGRRLIGWDEILESNPAPDAVVMSWRKVASAAEAAERGHDVVLTPAPTFYLDYCQAERQGEPTCRGPKTTLKDVYAFDPDPSGALAKHLIGVQANLWTEHLPTGAAVFYAAFPRAAAVAETGWSPARDWNGFLARLPAEFDRYRALGIGYSDAAFAVDVTVSPAFSVSLANQAGFGTIRYTLDGSPPTAASPAYTGPYDAVAPAQLSAATFVDDRRVGRVTTEHLDSLSVLARNSFTMDQCTNDLPLAQKSRDGKVMMVNVMNPCWIYRGLDLAVVTGFDIAVEKLPFNFQLMHDIKKIPLYPKAARGGQLEIHLDTCQGEALAVLPLSRRSRTLHASVKPAAGTHDVCFKFARRRVDPIWAIAWVQPRKE